MQQVSTPDAQARSFFTALRDRWWIVALCTFTAGALAFLTVHQQPGLYQATTVLGLHNQYLDRDIFDLGAAIKTTEETLASQPGSLDTTAAAIDTTERLGLQPATSARTILANTSVDLSTTLYLPVAHGRASTPAAARVLADTFATVIVERRARSDKRRIEVAKKATQARLDEVTREYVKASDAGLLDRDDLRKEVNRLTGKILRFELMLKFRPPTVYIAALATTPTSRTRPPALNIGIYAALFGAFMGCALLAWRENRDRRPRAGEILQDLRAAILTDLPRTALLPGSRPHGPRPGELRALDAVRRVLQADRPHSVVAVTEAITIGRASAAARLLAETAALSGSRTLFATNDPHAAKVTIDGLTVEPYPIEIGDVAGAWLDEQRSAYDLVVIDLPSPVGSGAALELASRADRVLAVWLPDSVHRRQLTRLGRTLARADIQLAGVVRVGGQAA
jgi:hypothetical protein